MDTLTVQDQMTDMGRRAKTAALVLATMPADAKDRALREGAKALRLAARAIQEANAKDMAFGREKGLSPALLDRLLLTDERIEAMAKGLEDIAKLPDPVGQVMSEWDRPNGLKISRVRTPLGVIGIIYESRPNVTADAGALCLKSGNAAILRGGSESFNSSHAILDALQVGLAQAGLPADAIQMVPTKDRAAVGALLSMDQYVDVIVPRGGKGLIERVSAESRIPMFKHLDGICHTYVHEKADPEMARQVVVNAKMRRTGICGSTETLLVDRSIAPQMLPVLMADLAAAGCTLRGDAEARAIVPTLDEASDEDWDTEYLDAILSVKVVDGVARAIEHIQRHSSQHTEAIITEDRVAAERFMNEIDSAILMWNASTQFADGGEFGMGAEIGISTGKLHARGPVGVEQLTTFKYKIRGNGQCRP
ncbi:glutamate-5-semialdehyde dehydrogenase [Insolitispirillum peregrinum]|uniref:Gamma-glutamyl phosphate reductase n=1 Tax=Insolitispirillum peregrinum TaxID=80876 RepID=A0A1N7P554_9PROT|nr:glutamate-5-semialdehyde dehydrogenase [Insolitispirillum peregrinum]SIT05656.1 glutamate-5-semialdehyde dehydrogenase [Insolitispirillum peregrinum]